MKTKNIIAAALICALAFTSNALYADGDVAVSDEAAKAAELAKKLSNPVASLVSVPFQANFDNGFGPNSRGSKFVLNVQPVIPMGTPDPYTPPK